MTRAENAAAALPPIFPVAAPSTARPWRRSRLRRWPRWAIGVSIALHLLALAFVLFGPTGAPPQQDMREGPAMSMVFDNSQPTQAETQSRPPQINLLPPEMRAPEMEPQSAENPPPETFAPDAEPVPQARPHHTSRPTPFSHPMQYSFAPPQSKMPTHGNAPPRGLNLSLAPVIRNGHLLDSVAHVSNPNASGDWLADLDDWINRHGYYPEQAGENGEEGSSVIEATIDRSGRVTSAKLVTSAGSRLLDVATLSIFRDQKLPPFPDDMAGKDITVNLTVNYQIIRQ